MLIIALVVLLALFLLFAYYISSRRPIENYPDPDGPTFTGSYAGDPGPFDGNLKVITWNVHFGNEVEKAIETLETVEALRDPDVLLLQEMNVDAVEIIAQQLGYNYVYYPSTIHPRYKKEFGNAILSKWPIKDPQKIVLPNLWFSWFQSRNAARAGVLVGDQEITVYSVHLDTIWMLPSWSTDQAEYLIEDVARQDQFTIVGGDFNSWSPGSIKALEDGFGAAGLLRLSEGTGHTFVASSVKLTLDHIFSSPPADYESGVYRESEASDHFPVWADLELMGEE
jgi:endonuclease/exonuclease/phosphatase family metal-dependent hydrolase